MKQNIKSLFALHMLLMVYSTSGIFSKLASGVPFLSAKFCFFYACIIGLLGVYAIGWQQILKRMPLTSAFSNKAITIVWGIIWGAIFFLEPITIPKIAGAILIIVGIVIFASADNNTQNESGSNG